MKMFLLSASTRGSGDPRDSQPGGRRYIPCKYIFMQPET